MRARSEDGEPRKWVIRDPTTDTLLKAAIDNEMAIMEALIEILDVVGGQAELRHRLRLRIERTALEALKPRLTE